MSKKRGKHPQENPNPDPSPKPENQDPNNPERGIIRRFGFTRRQLFILFASAALGVEVARRTLLREDPHQADQPEVQQNPPIENPEEVYQRVLAELRQKETAINRVIAFCEGELLHSLESLQTSNPALREVIDGIIACIRLTAQYTSKNSYSAAIRLLEQHKETTFREGLRQGHFRTAESFMQSVEAGNLWLVQPPYFMYRFRPNRSPGGPAAYSYSSGMIEFHEELSFTSLVEWISMIHELIHVFQAQRTQNISTPQQITNFRAYCRFGPGIPEVYAIDSETDAFAASFEIINLMTGADLERLIQRNATAPNTRRIQLNETDRPLINRLFGDSPETVQTGFYDFAFPYFLNRGTYPDKNAILETQVERAYPVEGRPVRLQDLLDHTPQELEQLLRNRPQ